MALSWKLHGDGKSLPEGAVVAPNERLTMPRMFGVAGQHVLTMFGGTVLFPLLMGLPFTVAVFMSGFGTLLFFLVVRGRIPSYLGSSAAFVGPAITVYDKGGTSSDVTGAVLMCGVALIIAGLVVHLVGARVLHRILPPLVTGAVVVLIALNVAPILNDFWVADQVIALITLIVVIGLARLLPGFWSRLAVVGAIVIGYLLSWAADGLFGPIAVTAQDGSPSTATRIDFSRVVEAKWFGLPDFQAPTFSTSAILVVLPVVIVLIAENVAHVKAVAVMTEQDLDGSMGRALIGDGLSTTLAGAAGASGTTTYAENIGVMAASRVYSSLAYALAGVIAMALGFCPKLGELVYSIPSGVLGGVLVYLVGLIAVIGAKTWVENDVDFRQARNYIPAAVGVCLGVGNMGLTFGSFFIGGVALGTVAVVVLYQLMRGRVQDDHGGPVTAAEAAD